MLNREKSKLLVCFVCSLFVFLIFAGLAQSMDIAPSLSRALAEKYMPVFKFSTEGGVNLVGGSYPYVDYIPIDVEDITSSNEVMFFSGGYQETLTSSLLKIIGSGAYNASDSYITLPKSEYQNIERNPTVYYRIFKNDNYLYPLAIQYWFFYYYNNWGAVEHEGDWESITVFLDEALNPKEAVYSTHYEAHRLNWNTGVQKQSGSNRPIVYVANGGHGSYAIAGQTTYLPSIVDHHHGDALVTLSNYSLSDLAPMEGTGGWLDFIGRFGKDGITTIPGPPSPLRRTDANTQVDWDRAMNAPRDPLSNCQARNSGVKLYGDNNPLNDNYGPWKWAFGYPLELDPLDQNPQACAPVPYQPIAVQTSETSVNGTNEVKFEWQDTDHNLEWYILRAETPSGDILLNKRYLHAAFCDVNDYCQASEPILNYSGDIIWKVRGAYNFGSGVWSNQKTYTIINQSSDLDGDGVADSDLVAYFPFDGNAVDSSGKGHDGTASGSAGYSNGVTGQALSLDGSGAKVLLPAPTDMRAPYYGISFWLKTSQTGNRVALLAAQYSHSSVDANGYEISINHPEFISGSLLAEHMTIATGNWGAHTDVAVNDGDWHHVVATFDGTLSKIYIDSNLSGTFDERDYPQYYPGPVRWTAPYPDFFQIGETLHTLRSGYAPLNGQIDELRIYKRPLGPSEVQGLYNMNAPDGDGDGFPDTVDTDSDNDGIPNSWEIAKGLNHLSADALSDPDGDGLSNFQEYVRGKDPLKFSDIVPPSLTVQAPSSSMALNTLNLSGSAEVGSKVEVFNMTGLPTQYLADATFAAYVKFPVNTSWDINAILADPAYADGVIDGEYLVIDGREFADYSLAPNATHDSQAIPAGIGLKYVIGADNSILVITNAPVADAFMALFGFHNTVNPSVDQLYYPTSISLTNAEWQQLWDAGMHMKVDMHTRFLMLPQFAMNLYQDWKGKGLVNNPLANVDVILQPEIGVLNNTGHRVAIGYAGNHSDGLSSQFRSADLLQAWWPAYPSTIDGSAEWGFDLDFNNLGDNWYTWSNAYGDNGSTQTIKWDGVVHAQHSNIGADIVHTSTSTPLPGSVALRHDNSWSANFDRFIVIAPADQLNYTNVWETPVVGDTPQPITFYIEKGWITDEPVTETGGEWSAMLNLAEGVNKIRVAATDAYGNRTTKDYTVEVKTTSPRNIEATDLGVGEVLLSWVNPADTDFNHIKIYRSTVAGQLGTAIADPVTGISYVDDIVAANTTYYYTVRAVDNVGNESTNTTQVALTTGDFDFVAPGAPTGVNAVDANTGGVIDLSWTNPVDGDFSHVTIYRSTAFGVLGALVANNVSGTSWQNTGLTNGVTYYYTLRAVDSHGNVSVDSDQAFATPTVSSGVAPGVVTDVSLTSPGTGGVLNLAWSNPADTDGDFAFVRIYRSMNSGVLGEVVHEASSGSSWQDTGLTSGSTYFYTLRGVDLAGNENGDVTQYGLTVSDVTAPLPVTGLKVSLLASGQIKLSWNESGSKDAAYYNVYWNNGSGAVDTTPANALASIADPTINLTTAALTVGTTYKFIVRVEDAVGNEETSTNIVSAVPINDPNAGGVCAYIKVPQTGHKVGGNSLTVMADLNCGVQADVQSIALQYKPVASGSWANIPTSDTNPDITAPYFIHWDVDAGCPGSCSYPDGEYLLRAVGTNTNSATDANPGSITITIEHNNPDSAENSTAGKQSKVETVYTAAPSSSSMGSGNGVTKVEIPANALGDDTTVIIEEVDTPPVAPPANYEDAGEYKDIHFGNGQGQLNNAKQARVSLSYSDDDGDGIVDGSNPPISIYDLQVCNDHNNTWTCLNSTIDTANKQVKGLVDKFSTFGLLVPPKLVGNDLTMVAVPLYPNPNSTASVLGPVNQYGTYTPVWNPLTGSWITRPATVEPGKSYFIWGNGNALNVSGTEVPQSNFAIALQPGWNMMGNPFRYQVPLSQITVSYNSQAKSLQDASTAGWVSGAFFHYVNGSWQTWTVQAGDALPTWKGFYVLSNVNCTLTIPPTPAGE